MDRASSGAVHGRFAAVHNTMVALGLNQLGHISEGSLGEGATVNLPVELTAQRYTFVAFNPVITSIPVCAQKAPLVPLARFAAVGQLVQ